VRAILASLRQSRLLRTGLAATLAAVTTGCTIVPIEADRAARERLSAAFDADRYVEAIWATQAEPHWRDAAKPLPELIRELDQDPAATRRVLGRRPGEGSPWFFVVTGEGRVTAVRPGRSGRMTVAVEGDSGAVHSVEVQLGPVVSGTALRDSLPFVTFNDFANQIDFAEVNSALTRRALRSSSVPGVAVGDRVRFSGVAPRTDDGGDWIVTPIRVERVGTDRAAG
jgi:predicted lipoprotein